MVQRIKVTGDERGFSWSITDADTGEKLDDVTELTIKVSPTMGAFAYLTRVAAVESIDAVAHVA